MRRLETLAIFTLFPCLLLLVMTPVVSAKGWEKVSQEEWELSSLPWYPDASAVILNYHTNIVLSDSSDPSRREEYVRMKILTEAGKKHGTISIRSNDYVRLKNLEARVVFEDKPSVLLPKDAVFEKEYSTYYNVQVTSVVMPGVEVGAIVEFKYTLYFDNAMRTWEVPLQAELPMLHREVQFFKPNRLGFNSVFTNAFDRQPMRKLDDNGNGVTITYVMTDVEPFPDEPYRPPYIDLVAGLQFLPDWPAVINQESQSSADSWGSLIQLIQKDYYGKTRKKAKQSRKTGSDMVSGVDSDVEKVKLLYRFVRDEIENDGWDGVFADNSLDTVLSKKKGARAEKAMLLQNMLEGAGISSSLGWTNTRDNGRASTRVANLGRVNTLLVAVTLDEETVYLDPSDPDGAYGYLQPGLEGVECLLVDAQPIEWVEPPELKIEDSTRISTINLEVDDEGRLTGDGRLELTGHHAWKFLGWKESDEETKSAWTDWLADRIDGHEIDDTEVDEQTEQQKIVVTWTMRQHDDEVLGDEVSVPVAMPLGISSNPFTLERTQRRTPVIFDFRDSDQSSVQVSWPEGWEVDIEPRLRILSNASGSLKTSMEHAEEDRTLVMTRRFDIKYREYRPGAKYEYLRQLFQRTAENDAETLILVNTQ